jgi:hypothetical protein
VNGTYKPTNEVYNDRVLFRKEGDGGMWLMYKDGMNCWVVGTTANKDAADALGYAFCDEEGLHDPAEATAWTVDAGGGDEYQLGVTCVRLEYQLGVIADAGAACPFRVGEKVQCRDGDSEWSDGIVESVAPLKVKKVGWDKAYSWDDVMARVEAGGGEEKVHEYTEYGGGEGTRRNDNCSICGVLKDKSDFSSNQWGRKISKRKCKTCVAANHPQVQKGRQQAAPQPELRKQLSGEGKDLFNGVEDKVGHHHASGPFGVFVCM